MKTQLLPFKNIHLLLLLSMVQTMASAQKMHTVLSKELQITDDTKIIIHGPEQIHANGNGMINARHLSDKYVVSGKSTQPYIFVINKNLTIKSWDKNVIKQNTKINIESESSTNTQKIIENLDVSLKENIFGEVNINFNLNIDQFKIRNGFFTKDRNSIILNDDQEFMIKYLELETELIVPKTSFLHLKTHNINIVMDDHLGKIKLEMKQGSFHAQSIAQFNAEVDGAVIHVKNSNDALIKAHHAQLNLGHFQSLVLSSSLSQIRLQKGTRLIIDNSVNDELILGAINDLDIKHALFSDFNIDNINRSITMHLKSSDTTIHAFHHHINNIDIVGLNADIKMPLSSLNDYQLIIHDPLVNRYQLPPVLKNIGTDKEFKAISLKSKTVPDSYINLNCKQCNINFN